ncbi:MAG: hypothetical protein BWY87_01346 [Deltaproteobacteria bacterium ADurb.Bin510]|nr:MAG: hypothetical protein BWY87_01346 [Deltaproteobacteria bacterium ADurb.Bin510]
MALVTQQAVQAPAEFGGGDLVGVAGADGVDPVATDDAGLEDVDAAVILHAIGVKEAGRQHDHGPEVGVVHALIGDVVDGEERGWPRHVERLQISRRQGGLPVVAVQDVDRAQVVDQFDHGPREEGEALEVVGVVLGLVGVETGRAKIVLVVDEKHVAVTVDLGFLKAGTGQEAELGEGLGLEFGVLDRFVVGHGHQAFDPQAVQGLGQGSADIG